MKVLVTGATGAVGRHLVRRLVEQGADVRALVRASSDTSGLDDVELFKGDLRDAESVGQAMRGCARVYHSGAVTSRMHARREEYESINITGTQNVVRAALKLGVERLVHISTAGNFYNREQRLMSESESPRSNNDYRRTKAVAEEFVTLNVREHRLPAVIARISSVYGPGLVNWLGLVRAVKGGNLRLIANGRSRKHLGFVTDVVDGLVRCGQTPGIEGQVYFLAGPAPVTIRELVDVVADALSIPRPIRNSPAWPFRIYYRTSEVTFSVFGRELPGAHRYAIFFEDQALDLSKARAQLGYNPAVRLPDGISRLVEWYRSKGYI
jgi:nucleoside-diphosphate-sugar epimerase